MAQSHALYITVTCTNVCRYTVCALTYCNYMNEHNFEFMNWMLKHFQKNERVQQHTMLCVCVLMQCILHTHVPAILK